MPNNLQRIHPLSSLVTKQIAAGEVIERPASVVKELLENSLDAGATQIDIDIKQGGRLLISIRDNGHGIHPDDLLLAVTQHATSKLSTPQELNRIKTLGFRGEALASIASVAKLKLASRTSNSEHGWLLEVLPPQELSDQEPTVMACGTCVEVRDLFFNVPARRKFLRTDNTERYHIQELTRRIALSHYHVAFCLRHNDKNIFQCQENDAGNRAKAIFGQSFGSSFIELDDTRQGMRLWGWLGTPETARSQTDRQYFYLNGRVIRNKQVNHAVRMVTQDHLGTGKHPVYVLFLEIEPSAVDVNVHPAKYEARFHRARDVHDFIYAVLVRAYTQRACLLNEKTVEGEQCAEPRYDTYTRQQHDHHKNDDMVAPTSEQSDAQSQQWPIPASVKSYLTESLPPRSKPRQNKLFLPQGAPGFTLIKQDPYLLVQASHQLLLIDLPACKEAVALDELRSMYEATGIRSRPLLVPLTLSVSETEANLLANMTPNLASYGLKIDRLAPGQVLVREIPLSLEYADMAKLVSDVIKLIKSAATTEQILTMMASHANDAGATDPDDREIEALIKAIKRIDAGAKKIKQQAWRTIKAEDFSELLRKQR